MNEEGFLELCEHLADHTWLQSLLVISGTCFLEDPARVGVAFLVAAGHIAWRLTFINMTIGAMVGDLGLYLIGRYATGFLQARGWLNRARLLWIDEYFANHAAKSVVVSRFLPGARTITFMAAGVARYPLPRYLLLLLIAGAAQALIFLQLGALIGEYLLPYLNKPITHALLFFGTLLFGTAIYWWIGKGYQRKFKERQR